MSLTSPPATRPVPPLASQEVLGIPLALTDYTRTLDWIDAAVAARQRAFVCVAAVHTVMASREDRARLESELLSMRKNGPGSEVVSAENAELRQRINEVADLVMRESKGKPEGNRRRRSART